MTLGNRSHELLKLERARALGDFYWFVKYVVSGGVKNNLVVPHVHRDLCDTLQTLGTVKPDGCSEALVLMPRGTLKSTIGAQAWPIWLLLNNPDLRILIASSTTELATLNMRTIKSIIEGNGYFRQLFGDMVQRNDREVATLWNQDEILTAGRSERGRQLKEASITCGALEKIKAGSHYDVVILDDVVNHLNTRTPQQVDKTKTFYAQVHSQLDPVGSMMLIIGTRYLYDDLYGWLLGENEEKRVIPDRVIVKKAIDDQGVLLFPEALSHEKLEELRKKQGAYHFACQYLNEPTNPDTAVFLRGDFRYIGTHVEKVPSLVTRFLLVDPSRGEDVTSDYSGLCVVAMDEANNLYIELADARRVKPSELADWIYSLHSLYRFDRIGVEQVAMQGIYDLILDRVNRGADWIPVMPVRTSTSVSKQMRIRRMEPYFRARKVYMMPGMRMLEDQLERFPNIRYDDLVDSLSMILDVGYLPNSDDSKKDERKRVRSDIADFSVGRSKKHDDDAWLNWKL